MLRHRPQLPKAIQAMSEEPMPCPSRRLPAAALDVGRARIGLAHTDPRAEVALPADVLNRQGTRLDLGRLVPWLQRLQMQVCVVGLPPQQDGDDSGSSRLCRQFAEKLAQAWPEGEVWLVDESDTTAEAHAELRLLGQSAAKRRRDVDRYAAKQILDRWLAGALAERCTGGDHGPV
jgi:putative Holliday junction resolvase